MKCLTKNDAIVKKGLGSLEDRPKLFTAKKFKTKDWVVWKDPNPNMQYKWNPDWNTWGDCHG